MVSARVLLALCIVAGAAAFVRVGTNVHTNTPAPALRGHTSLTCRLEKKRRPRGGWHTPSGQDSRHLELLEILQTVVNRQPPRPRGGGGGGGGARKRNAALEQRETAAEMGRALARWYGPAGKDLSLEASMAIEDLSLNESMAAEMNRTLDRWYREQEWRRRP